MTKKTIQWRKYKVQLHWTRQTKQHSRKPNQHKREKKNCRHCLWFSCQNTNTPPKVTARWDTSTKHYYPTISMRITLNTISMHKTVVKNNYAQHLEDGRKLRPCWNASLAHSQLILHLSANISHKLQDKTRQKLTTDCFGVCSQQTLHQRKVRIWSGNQFRPVLVQRVPKSSAYGCF